MVVHLRGVAGLRICLLEQVQARVPTSVEEAMQIVLAYLVPLPAQALACLDHALHPGQVQLQRPRLRVRRSLTGDLRVVQDEREGIVP